MKAVLILALPLVTNYLLSWIRFEFGSLGNEAYRTPATVPYIFPILCSSVNFVWDPLRFIRSATYVRQHPIMIMILTENSKDFAMEDMCPYE